MTDDYIQWHAVLIGELEPFMCFHRLSRHEESSPERETLGVVDCGQRSVSTRQYSMLQM